MSDEKAGGQAKPQDYRRGNALDGRAARWVTKDVVYRQARANDGRDNRPSRERARAHVSEPRHDNGGAAGWTSLALPFIPTHHRPCIPCSDTSILRFGTG
jgi:hypothetical protein